MKQIIRQTLVVARRDFLATVATPTFLLFLLAPLIMLAFGMAGGLGVSQIADSATDTAQIVAIAAPEDATALIAEDQRRRALSSPEAATPRLRIEQSRGDDEARARELLVSRTIDVIAVMHGPLDHPTIVRSSMGTRSGAYLAALAEDVERNRRAGIDATAELSAPRIVEVTRSKPSRMGQQGIGVAAVFTVFFLTLLLAGQAVGMLAEEKGNKVIEILAAAVPLEAVFLGKLLGMFGVALLFIGFWGAIGTAALVTIASGSPLAMLTPAIGMPLFVVFAALYFTTAYLLLGAVFLGVGAQAATVREIQMLSLPITIFQVAMFGLSSAAASSPGSSVALFAEIFPFSSPFAMAAHGANDPRLWPLLAALGWQILWVALTITLAARMFRRGVLQSSAPASWRRIFARKKRETAETLAD